VRELVIAFADLYLSAEPGPSRERGRKPAVPTPSAEAIGLDTLARFGTRTSLSEGWRHAVAQAIGVPQFAALAPATVAAAGAAAGEGASPGGRAPVDARTVWVATPLYLAAGLTTLHLDRRSILRLASADLASLAADFNHTFDGSGFSLVRLESGEALLFAAEEQIAKTVEPARIVGEDVANALPDGAGASSLRRLGAEMELWLHDHPLNRGRAARGEPPVSTLWLWGGDKSTHTSEVLVSAASTSRIEAASGLPAVVTFGSDSTLRGLARLAGLPIHPLPGTLDEALSYSADASLLVVMEVGPMLRANSRWTLADALAELDRRFLEPAIGAVRRGHLRQTTLIANDRRLVYGSRDHLRLWRRPRAGLEALR
jgi:hypothetical protein